MGAKITHPNSHSGDSRLRIFPRTGITLRDCGILSEKPRRAIWGVDLNQWTIIGMSQAQMLMPRQEVTRLNALTYIFTSASIVESFF